MMIQSNQQNFGTPVISFNPTGNPDTIKEQHLQCRLTNLSSIRHLSYLTIKDMLGQIYQRLIPTKPKH